MRKCTLCRSQIPMKKDCTDPYQKAGFCNRGCQLEHTTQKALKALERKKAKDTREARQKATQERKEQREAKERLKSKGDYAKEAQQAFNAWIRLRDDKEPCISCGRHHQGQYHAGHYRTVGSSPELRFEPLNVHKQCSACNNHLSGNIVGYRIWLQEKIGAESLEWLEGPHEPKRYTIDDLKQIKTKYRRLARELIKEIGDG